jgi:hypothetical protein
MDEENLVIHTASYTDDMEADDDSAEDWNEFDDREIVFLEKHLQYN